MKNHNLARVEDSFTYEELDNLKNNIIKKIAQLNISLPELAKLMNIEYQTLRRITYREDGYFPNFRMLYPIADFFDVTVSDLLKNPNLPQYIPIINLSDVNHFLTNNLETKNGKTIFCEKHVHVNAFAINIEIEQYGSFATQTFIFKPFTKFMVDALLLITYEDRYYLFKVNEETERTISGYSVTTNNQLSFKKDQVNVLGIATKQIMNNELL